MLRMTSGLSRPVLKWVSQVTASLGATLAATLIWSAVPHSAAAPRPELTSSGKFAARAIEPAADPVAYDGLDTMPLPRVAPAPTLATIVPAEAAPVATLRRTAWDAPAPSAPVPDRSPRDARTVRPVVHAEARRSEPASRPAAAPVAVAAASDRITESTDDEGVLRRLVPSGLPHILPTIASTARDAWTITASAGGTLVARVVPQLP